MEAPIKEEEETQSSLPVLIRGIQDLRWDDNKEVEKGGGKEVEMTQQGEAREALTQEGQIIIKEGVMF